MKRIALLGMVLILSGMAFAAFPMSAGDAAPTVTVVMRSDTTGLPVTGITAAHIALKFGQGPGTYLSAAKTGEAAAYNAAWAEPTSGYVGWCEEITSGSTGPGSYRIYLPIAFMTNAAPRQTRTIEVIDATDSARAILQVLFNPADSSLPVRIESVIMENICATPVIYVVMSKFVNGVETIGTDLTITNFTLYYKEGITGSVVGPITLSALASDHAAYGGSTGAAKGYQVTGNSGTFKPGKYRIDLPPESVDGGAGTVAEFFITDGTYSARKEVQLTPSVNVVLSGGTPPPTAPANFSSLFIEPATGAVNTASDDDVTAIKAKTDYLPSATAGAAGGVFIAGTNAATTITSGATNQAALTLTGNGTGAGISANGGATGRGMELFGGATGGSGLYSQASAAGYNGIYAVGGPTGGNGIYATGQGTGFGLNANLPTSTMLSFADYFWDEVLSTGHTTPNSAGKILYDNLNAPVATVDTVVDGLATEMAKIPKTDGAMSFNETALTDIADAVMDEVIENNLTFRNITRILSAVLVGKSSYSGGVVTFTGLDGTTVRARVTISGQSRTSVTGLDGN
jgi:hypothetical protein